MGGRIAGAGIRLRSLDVPTDLVFDGEDGAGDEGEEGVRGR